MPSIEFPAGTRPGRTPQESGGRLINCYGEPLGQDGLVVRRVPGLRRWATSPMGGYRGSILVGSTLYAAFEGEVNQFDSAGATDPAGSLAGTGKVFFARNNHVDLGVPAPQVVAVTEVGAFVLEAGPSWAAYPDGDLPASVAGVTFLDGYFFFWTPDGRMIASAINGQAIDALDIATAESSPDGLRRLVPFDGQLIAMGAQSLEFWSGNPPNASAFPFNRIAVAQRGLASPWAVTGFEPGFGKVLAWVGDDNAVHVLSGYQPQRISTDDLDRLIEAVADKSTIEMFCYVAGGHSCVVVRCPAWTWVFDLATQKWHERRSYLVDTWRAMGNSVFAFGKWLVGDAGDGLHEVTEGVQREDGAPLVFQAEDKGSRAFPQRFRVSEAHFALVPGVGDASGLEPIETNPVAHIHWSDDGGANWSQPVTRELGRQGHTHQRISVYRAGVTGPWGRRWRVEVFDPVYAGLLGGSFEVG
jgi:hypothetical protein